MADFKVEVPSALVRRAARSSHRTRGTIGVHAQGGSWLANGSAGGLVKIEIDPPCHTERCLSALFRRMEVGPDSRIDPIVSVCRMSEALLAFAVFQLNVRLAPGGVSGMNDSPAVGLLAIAADVGPADWVVTGLRGHAHDVGSIVPATFEAYARVFHPAGRAEGGSVVEVRWAEVAQANGQVMHPAAEWGSITGSHH